ncbi:ATP-binding cassette domain-containing protein [Actinomadura sp. LD22]|uniref:ATP-binding cassette domain-containing protein n=1 Tax=Actinomadura physcomitrii TaxID=2650748 RepID=A0A6I4MF63_9ACTN|nr:sugar ABC transporter ATP-binding protein [Actinomadura physcomitrii]MWA02607.1 ATP-binding cassette domain-containing protein [Actinomadura physcomitrii]
MRMQLADVHKSFGENHVLRGVSLAVEPGEVVALCGENGAGKSTLTRVISGAHQPDGGRILIDGEAAVLKDPQAAMALGIEVIYQEFQQNLFPNLSVAENMHVLDREGRFGRLSVSRRRMAEAASSALRDLGLDIDVRRPVGELGVAERQMVEIAKAMTHRPRLLILDEPTAALDERESERLFEQVRRLREAGVTILYISHRLDEVFELSDRIVVLRDGRVTLDEPTGSLTPARVVTAMVGDTVDDFYPKERNATDRVVLRVRGASGGAAFHGVDLDVRAGEVLGIGGVVGCGRGELLRALFGLHPLTAGTVTVDGEPVRARDPRQAIAGRIAYVTPDRSGEGLAMQQSVEANVSLPSLGRFTTADVVRRGRERAATGKVMADLRVRAASPSVPVASLSGGNQQKTLFAKWVMTGPRVLLMDEPTRGVDVGAKTEIYRIINGLTADGVAVVLVSSDLPELVAMSDRVLVMREGRAVSELAGGDVNEQNILEHALVGAP